MKTLLQCDFDATLTIGEVSHALIDRFGQGDWKQIQREYYTGRTTVEDCNIRQFALIKDGPGKLRDFLINSGEVVLKPGFSGLFAYAADNGWDISIISNGLDFYIRTILDHLGINNIRLIAAASEFSDDGIILTYPGPDGTNLKSGFKSAWAETQRQEYDRIYFLGDGAADVPPARLADHVFATSVLRELCEKENIPYTPFDDLNDVIGWLKTNQETPV